MAINYRNLGRYARSLFRPRAGAPAEYPLEVESKRNALHARAGVDRHLDILFKDLRIGERDFVGLYRQCLARTGTLVTPFNAVHRFHNRFNLLQYLFATLRLPGARAECGVYRGATSLLICEAWRTREPDFKGRDLYLIDSFSGTSASGRHDLIPVRGEDGRPRMKSFFPPGKSDTSAERVRGYLGDFPEIQIRSGWIPDVLDALPDHDWAFIHLDVTLHEPTLAALEYFVPRLARDGVIYCDGSIFCPGVQRAVDAYCTGHGVPYLVLDNHDFVIVGS